MRKTFEIPPNNGKNSLFLRSLLQDAESMCSRLLDIFTSNELTERIKDFTEYLDKQWIKFCSVESGDLSKEEAAKLFKEIFNCTSAEFERYF